MGRDKAFLPVDGRPLAISVAEALQEAGAADVFAVGGDAGRLAALGLDVVPDHYPGEGPLGALVTALRAARHDIVVVLACDLPAASSSAVHAVVRALEEAPTAAWAAPDAGGRRQWLHAAYRRATLPHWEAAFARGERSVHRPAGTLTGVTVSGVDPRSLVDVDAPEDLPGGRGRPVRSPEPDGPSSREADDPPSPVPPDCQEALVDPQVPEIDVDTLARRRDVPLVDVREVAEYDDAHVPGSRLLPMSEVADRVDELPSEGEVFLICRSGNRSQRVAEFLRAQGIDAVNVAGGMIAWVEAGHTTASGLEPG